MNKKNWILIAWLTTAILIAGAGFYCSHFGNPENGITFGMLLIIMTFPLGILVQLSAALLLKQIGIADYNMIVNFSMNLLIVFVGYLQWFVLIPYLKRNS